MPEIWTCAVLVVLPGLRAVERDEPVLSYTHEQQADEDKDDNEPPNNTDADEADGCGLVPVTCCGNTS